MDIQAAVGALKKKRPLFSVPPYMPREIEHKRSVAGHEVFMSFNTRGDAEAFRDWIGDGGWAAFLAWYVAREPEET